MFRLPCMLRRTCAVSGRIPVFAKPNQILGKRHPKNTVVPPNMAVPIGSFGGILPIALHVVEIWISTT
ncbi:hypothetical protein GB880_013540 [Paracoccus sp. SMMA_5_TC]|uniref:hypothetical protein n=1 Tax=Paracoccus sp. SMMA_5_TC TaxID=2654280 RepID=UPI0012B1A81D|nr:hypothetical protein [Paracoccus sp. SMMA_5_TC]UXU80795.1 hypothetical protein GB880_013540 [Paracoccus sp. SMMA_5_TC]